MRDRSVCLLVAVLAAVWTLFTAASPAAPGGDRLEPGRAVIAAREADRRYLTITPATLAMSIDELAAVYDTPAKVWYLLAHTVRYAYDREVYGVADYFATAEELWARKQGDCEDWAIFARALLERNGYTTVLFSVWHGGHDSGGNDGHTVLAVLEQGRWNHISNLGYVRAAALTQEDLASAVFRNWTRCNTWRFTGPARSVDGHNGWYVGTMTVNRSVQVRI